MADTVLTWGGWAPTAKDGRPRSAWGRLVAACRTSRHVGTTRRHGAIAACVLLLLVLAFIHRDILRLMGRLYRGTPAPHTFLVATFNTWAAPADMLDELWVLQRVFKDGAGATLTPVASWLPMHAQMAAADVVIVSVNGHRFNVEAMMAAYPSATFLFINGENTINSTWWDQMAGVAHLAMGQRQDLEEHVDWAAAPHAKYLRLPWWLPYALDRDAPGCTLAPSLSLPPNPEEWRRRAGFATLLSRHYNYPRPELHAAFSVVGRVDCPSVAFHNMEWPARLPNSHLSGKIEFLSGYRYNLCPENSESAPPGVPGYNTEKAAQALMAGTVPVYWGDTLDPGVFNPHRLLRLDGNMTELMRRVQRLEDDAEYRREFFSHPVLAPTAQAWADAWCGLAGEHAAWAVARMRAQRGAAGVTRG